MGMYRVKVGVTARHILYSFFENDGLGLFRKCILCVLIRLCEAQPTMLWHGCGWIVLVTLRGMCLECWGVSATFRDMGFEIVIIVVTRAVGIFSMVFSILVVAVGEIMLVH